MGRPHCRQLLPDLARSAPAARNGPPTHSAISYVDHAYLCARPFTRRFCGRILSITSSRFEGGFRGRSSCAPAYEGPPKNQAPVCKDPTVNPTTKWRGAAFPGAAVCRGPPEWPTLLLSDFSYVRPPPAGAADKADDFVAWTCQFQGGRLRRPAVGHGGFAIGLRFQGSLSRVTAGKNRRPEVLLIPRYPPSPHQLKHGEKDTSGVGAWTALFVLGDLSNSRSVSLFGLNFEKRQTF